MSRHRRKPRRVVLVAVLTGFVLLAGSVVVGWQLAAASGARAFIVDTPSMGRAAPVGTLVITRPTRIRDLGVGDIITFHPPGRPEVTFTHRIIDVSGGTVGTRGDINGATDPWRITDAQLVGRVDVVLPMVGWLVRSVPIVVLVTLVIAALAAVLPLREQRSALRLTGLSLGLSIAVWVLRPLSDVVLLQTTAAQDGTVATVVSTGLLPIRVTAPGGAGIHLVDGQVGDLAIRPQAGVAHYALTTSLDLPQWGWLLFGLICLLPFLWCLVVGLPREPVPSDPRGRRALRTPMTPAAAG